MAAAIAGENVRRLLAGELTGYPLIGALASQVLVQLDDASYGEITSAWRIQDKH